MIMTKPALYAVSLHRALLAVAVAAACGLTAALPAAAQDNPICAACLAPVIAADQVSLVPAALDGLEVFVRADAGTDVAVLAGLRAIV
ncbi:MAG: hypothetical protein ABJC51_08230, partial [Acidobacteriota bacterium]